MSLPRVTMLTTKMTNTDAGQMKDEPTSDVEPDDVEPEEARIDMSNVQKESKLRITPPPSEHGTPNRDRSQSNGHLAITPRHAQSESSSPTHSAQRSTVCIHQSV